MNLIDRDELIEKLNECIDMTKRYIENVDSAVIKRQLIGRREVLEIVLEGVNNQPPVNQWIPCKERLPKEDEFVLTCNIHGEIEILYFYDDVESCDMLWLDINEKAYEGIIAWQPLPKPYSEE